MWGSMLVSLYALASPLPFCSNWTKIGVGINVFANANVVNDSMGSCRGPDWAETGARFLARGRGDRDGDFWAQ